jgi:hypothetical protein
MMHEFDDSSDIDQEIRINELREAAKEAAGGDMTTWESPDMPPGLAESFWSNVLAYESAEETCHFIQLEEMGVKLPEPNSLSDDAVTATLWEVIHALASMDVFLSQTDHWNDRELYEHLWNDTLREVSVKVPPGSGWTHHIDFLSTGSEEDNLLYLKYYADEEWREQWRKDFPDDLIPDHVDPPYERDSKLPQAPQP